MPGSGKDGNAQSWSVVTGTDQGLGIPEEDIRRMFEQFQRGTFAVCLPLTKDGERIW